MEKQPNKGSANQQPVDNFSENNCFYTLIYYKKKFHKNCQEKMNEPEQTYHVPVLLHESIEGMHIQPGGTYVDVTFGGGGHSKEILNTMDATGKLFSFDQDQDAERNIVNDKRFTFVRSNFRYLHNFLRYYGVDQVDAILADLGVSSHHFDDSERGFSFRFDGQLDMRMNKRAGMTATDIVNTYDEERLADIFYLYGELKNSRKLAAVLVKARVQKKIATIGDFLEIIKPLFGKEREKKELAKVFQALRIEVNQEMEALKEMLYAATEALKPGGRLVIITYHSLEDRMVKNIMKTGNVEGKAEKDFFGNIQTPFKLVNNKVIVPSEEEIARNPRSKEASHISLRSILGGEILVHSFLRRQVYLLILIVILTILYIDNRYSSQQELIEIDRLKKELTDIKYDALTISSELTEKSRQSRIEEYISAEGRQLQTAATPPFLIKEEEE